MQGPPNPDQMLNQLNKVIVEHLQLCGFSNSAQVLQVSDNCPYLTLGALFKIYDLWRNNFGTFSKSSNTTNKSGNHGCRTRKHKRCFTGSHSLLTEAPKTILSKRGTS